MKKYIFPSLILALGLTACNTPANKEYLKIEAPMAKKVSEELTIHGDTRIDDYFWMRLSDEQKNAETPDEQTQQVLDYLNAENDYTQKAMANTADLQKSLFEEIKGRIKKDDSSVPYSKNGFSYYTKYEKGNDYPYYCRKADGSEGEEIMLDGPALAKGYDYFAIGGNSVSPNNKLIVYGVDIVSRRQYTLMFKNLETGDLLNDKIENTSGGAVWANNNKTVFYTKKDPQTLRSFRIYKHELGTDQKTDKLVFEETDPTFSCFVYKSKSNKYIFIGSSQTLSTEYRYLNADKPNGEWKLIQPRERDMRYQPMHMGDDFYILTNQDAMNYKLVRTPINASTKENWKEVIAHRPEVLIESVELFKDYLVLQERVKGLTEIRVMSWDKKSDYYIEFNDPAYESGIGTNPSMDTKTLRFSYNSMTTPPSQFDMNMKTKEKTLLKQQEVVDEFFSPDNYTSERLWAKARDGKLVPISLVYKKGTNLDGSAPLLQYGYGSYGASIGPGFSSTRLSLLNRGFIFAIAHIRGSQTLGREWYEDGKLLNKMNTFTDFIDCAEYLIANNYTSKGKLYAQGGSAGGLLMGGVVNMRPDLWNGVLAAVPFVDVVSTMLDETIPLTTFEFDEWGNPKVKEYYDYIKEYSPYDNVVAKDYPNMLITTGYWDSQVQYWEPAKWIAKLRANKTDDNLLIMDCDMEVGHGGASGRFKRYEKTSLEYAFLLSLEDIKY